MGVSFCVGTMNPTVYWAKLAHKDWVFHLAATEEGLCCIELPNGSLEEMREWLQRRTRYATLVHSPEHLEPYTTQLKDYLDNTRRQFDMRLALYGTEFQRSVWQALSTIPFGETRSYLDIASEVRRPKAVRAVGAANGANPIPIVLPCHRVIGKSGSLVGYGGGLDMKTRLLHLEGALA